MNYKIKIILKSFFVLVIFALTLKVGAFWNPPSMSAPNGNTLSPLDIGVSPQFKNGSFVAQGLKATVAGIFEGSLQIVPNAGLGKVLTSDAAGMATWQTPTGGSGNGGGDVTSPPGTGGTVNYVTKWTGPTAIGNSQVFDNGTFVGVGTNTPVTGVKVDVNGKVKMTGFQLGSTATAGQVLTTDASGNGTWQPPSAGGGNGWTDDGPVVRLTNSTDKVGVGTVAPAQSLEITGNFRMPNTIKFYSSSPGNGVIFRPNEDYQNGRFMHNLGGTYLGERAGDIIQQQVSRNTGIGYYALPYASSGSGTDNTAMGDHVMIYTDANNDTSHNTAVGTNDIGKNNKDNTSVGQFSLNFTFDSHCCSRDQINNTAFGEGALNYDVENLHDPSFRHNNTSVGQLSMGTNKNGSDNTSLGYNTDISQENLSNTTAVGANVVVNASNTMVFGTNGILGWGFGVQPGSAIIRVGDDATNGNGATLVASGWTQGSDRNKKHNIQDINYGLAEIMKLHPVSFDWNKTNQHDIGFIAQEVKPIIPEVVAGEEESYTMAYQNLTPVLAKALQELKADSDEMNQETSILEAQLK